MKITRILLVAISIVALVSTSCQQKSGKQKSSESEAMGADEFKE